MRLNSIAVTSRESMADEKSRSMLVCFSDVPWLTNTPAGISISVDQHLRRPRCLVPSPVSRVPLPRFYGPFLFRLPRPCSLSLIWFASCSWKRRVSKSGMIFPWFLSIYSYRVRDFSDQFSTLPAMSARNDEERSSLLCHQRDSSDKFCSFTFPEGNFPSPLCNLGWNLFRSMKLLANYTGWLRSCESFHGTV